jgi:uncharacterized membrane protein
MPAGASSGEAVEVTSDGTAVGTVTTTTGERAVVWRGGRASLLPLRDPRSTSRAVDVAEDGTVLGSRPT